MMNTLVIAEHDNQHLNNSTNKTVTAAAKFQADITVLVAGFNCEAIAKACAKLTGVRQVLWVDDPAYQHLLPENLSELIVNLGKNYSHILAPATTFGKNLFPRVAALFDVAQISDIIAIKDKDTFVRPIYAGNAVATVQSLDAIKVITIRTSAFTAATFQEALAPIERVANKVTPSVVEFIKQEFNQSTRPELSSARVVISGGRGLQSGENFKLLESLADRLQAAIGASRAAVDAGFVPNDYQVGQTGKIIAPELYIAVGISGAIQHLAGMKESKVIVAINKDEEAPIFKIADYGLVGDLFTIIPELIAELDKSK